MSWFITVELEAGEDLKDSTLLALGDDGRVYRWRDAENALALHRNGQDWLDQPNAKRGDKVKVQVPQGLVTVAKTVELDDDSRIEPVEDQQMDPTACWQRLLDAVSEGDVAEATQALSDLNHWLTLEGHPPEQWICAPDGAVLYSSHDASTCGGEETCMHCGKEPDDE